MAKSLRDLHDVELAALSAAGGRREFGELVRRHGSAVRGLLRRMGAQPSEADDVAQDAFIQAFQRSHEFRGEGTLLVDGLVAVRKSGTGKIEIEAAAQSTVVNPMAVGRSEGSFIAVKRKVYEGLAVVGGG